jgi:[ribosomal protein S5]-alanine N-acetyltransferase
MKTIETNRLILRELLPSDDKGMFELDSDPEVLKYIGIRPVTDIDESRRIIAMVRAQYIRNGIGRWAVIEKATGDFAGWAGLKYETRPSNGIAGFYDIGYRLLRRHWGKGYATEASVASLEYGFNELSLDAIHATADMENLASRKVLEKAGLKFIEKFIDEGYEVGWYGISREEWMNYRSGL